MEITLFLKFKKLMMALKAFVLEPIVFPNYERILKTKLFFWSLIVLTKKVKLLLCFLHSQFLVVILNRYISLKIQIIIDETNTEKHSYNLLFIFNKFLRIKYIKLCIHTFQHISLKFSLLLAS